MSWLERAATGLTLGLSFTAASAGAQDCGVFRPLPAFGQPLTIPDKKGPARFKVDVAASEVQRERGLMCRKSLGRQAADPVQSKALSHD